MMSVAETHRRLMAGQFFVWKIQGGRDADTINAGRSEQTPCGIIDVNIDRSGFIIWKNGYSLLKT